jgi:molybdopterin synthase catalytic subunit
VTAEEIDLPTGHEPPTVSIALSTDPLDPSAAFAGLRDDTCGAQVQFVGVVRDHDGGRPVREIEYVAHPDAQRVLATVVASTLAGHPAVRATVAWHRTGILAIGDVALVAAVASPHRAEAFAACTDLIERIKHEVPIWKRQLFADGHHEWSNAPQG